VLPILDPLAERRLYFGMLGLLLIAADFVSRLRISNQALSAGCAAVVLLAAGVTHARAEVWSNPEAFWEDTASKSPEKWRTHFQLGNAYYNAGHCAQAAAEFQRTAELEPPAYDLLVDWGLAYDCLNRPEEALQKLRAAAAISPMANVYSQMGMVYAKRSRWTEALDALATAEKLEPGFFMTYYYKGGVHLATKQNEAALQDYQRALELRPNFEPALQGLSMARARLGLVAEEGTR
jgi:tetratricopeptide (TPR) repeat protein